MPAIFCPLFSLLSHFLALVFSIPPTVTFTSSFPPYSLLGTGEVGTVQGMEKLCPQDPSYPDIVQIRGSPKDEDVTDELVVAGGQSSGQWYLSPCWASDRLEPGHTKLSPSLNMLVNFRIQTFMKIQLDTMKYFGVTAFPSIIKSNALNTSV